MKNASFLFASFLLCATSPVDAKTSASAASLQANVEKLVSFGTRHTLSSADDPKRGIGAARKWVASQFDEISKKCKNCMTVETIERRFDGPRAPSGANVVDVLGILPGKMGWDHVIIIAAHIDSRVSDVMNATSDAPGANDDGSGTALVLEAAKVLSAIGIRYNATIVFAVLSGEEQGLWGGKLLADTAKARGWHVSAMLNNDIVGNTVGTDGSKVDNLVRVFSEGIRASEDLPTQMQRRASGGEDDGPSRALLRYTETVADSFPLGIKVFGVRRPDRFSRGGDHLPALELGFPSIRYTVGVENYNAQHQDLRTENGITYGDTPDKMDFEYLKKITVLNMLTAGNLASAPPAPESATLSGALSSDTKISWTPVKGAKGYHVYWRRADAQNWQDFTEVTDPSVSTTIMKGKIVDDNFFGVASVDENNAESIITFAGLAPK